MESINRIKGALGDAHKTNRWLADQLGKDQTTVSKWCSNKSQPSLETLMRIAKCLNIDVRELLVSNNKQP